MRFLKFALSHGKCRKFVTIYSWFHRKILTVIDWQRFKKSVLKTGFQRLWKRPIFSVLNVCKKVLNFAGLWCPHQYIHSQWKIISVSFSWYQFCETLPWIRLQWPLEKVDSSYPSKYSFLSWVIIKLSLKEQNRAKKPFGFGVVCSWGNIF